MLMDTGGNCGSQASVTVIRGLSLGEIEFSDLFRVIWKEMPGGAALRRGAQPPPTSSKLMLVDRLLFGNPITMTVAAVICLTLIVTVFAAKLVGCTLPLLAKKIGFDPAVMASPFITTVVDAISLAHLLPLRRAPAGHLSFPALPPNFPFPSAAGRGILFL